jgi:hypothetical protein
MATEKLVKAPERRVKRAPVEGKNRLTVKNKDPNYVYRYVNDTEDRISDFLERGWEFATEESARVGDTRVDETSKLGTARAISVGGGTKAYLLRMKKEWYDEDQLAKQEYVKKTEAAMRPNSNEGTYGKVDISHKLA